jgi:pullulanase/glycogen debranching enzyme
VDDEPDVFVPGVRAGELYGYYADGPNQPDQGLVFDGIKLLVDPYTGTGNRVNACSDHRS